MLANSATKRSAPLGEIDLDNQKQCQICGRYFDRKDALRRHLHIHAHDRPPPKSRKTACVSCVRSKVKCLGERPACSRCCKRGLSCLYEQDRTSISHADAQDGTASRPVIESSIYTSESQAFQTQGIRPQEFSTEGSQDAFDQNQPNEYATMSLGAYLSVPFTGSSMHSQMDWIFYDSFDNVFPNPMPMQMLPLDPTLLTTSEPSMAPARDHGQEQALLPQTLPDRDVIVSQAPTSQPDETNVLDDGWNTARRVVPVQLSSIPSLGEDEDQTTYPIHFSLPSVGDSVLASLRSYLQTLPERSPWQPISLDAFPSREQMDYFIDLYFVHFDRFYPVIHRPTFDPTKESVLTLSMAVIGACYSGSDGARNLATSLGELTRRLLLYMAEQCAQPEAF